MYTTNEGSCIKFGSLKKFFWSVKTNIKLWILHYPIIHNFSKHVSTYHYFSYQSRLHIFLININLKNWQMWRVELASSLGYIIIRSQAMLQFTSRREHIYILYLLLKLSCYFPNLVKPDFQQRGNNRECFIHIIYISNFYFGWSILVFFH